MVVLHRRRKLRWHVTNHVAGSRDQQSWRSTKGHLGKLMEQKFILILFKSFSRNSPNFKHLRKTKNFFLTNKDLYAIPHIIIILTGKTLSLRGKVSLWGALKEGFLKAGIESPGLNVGGKAIDPVKDLHSKSKRCLMASAVLFDQIWLVRCFTTLLF